MMAVIYDDEQAKPSSVVYDDEAPRSWGDTLRNIRESVPSVQSVVRGMPIIGPAIDRATTYGLAAPEAAVTGNSVGGVANKYEQENERVRTEHPYANAAGEVAGSLLTAVPAARAFPKVFGGATLPGQMAAGSVIGGTDSAIRSGGDLDQIKMGAGIGAAGPVIGSILAPAGQAVAGLARGARDYVPGVNRVFAPRVAVPEGQAVLDAADAGYKRLGGMMTYDPASLNDLTNLIKRDLHGRSASAQIGAKETHAVLDTLDSLPPNPASLHTVRKELGKITGGDEGASARYARDIIDNFLEAPPPHAVVTTPQNAGNAYQTLKDANANWQAGKTSGTLTGRLDQAATEAQHANMLLPSLAEGQIIRRNLNTMLKNKSEMRYVLPEQRDAIANALTPQSIGQGILDTAGKVSQTARPGFGALVPFLVSGGVGTAAGGPAVGAALSVGGAASNLASTAMTKRAANMADELIRARSPFGQQAVNAQRQPPISLTPPFNPQLHSSISPIAHRNEIARLLTLQAQRTATENTNVP